MQLMIKRLIVICIFCMLPVSVLAMAPVADSDLSQVTGQAGVNINADLRMDIAIGTMAWGDADGLTSAGGPWTTTAAGGYVGVTGFNITNLRIKARENDTYNGYTTARLKPITIDVASDPTYVLYTGATFVRFGLGSLQITMDAMSFDVALGASGTALNEELGSVNIGAMAMYINPWSYVDIYNSRPGGRQGVFVTMEVIVDRLDIGYISWGDSDGLPAGNTGAGGCVWMAAGPSMAAGYVGLDNLVIGGPIAVTGTVGIDVCTSRAGIYAHGSPGTPTSVVHITFPRVFRVAVTGPITADVKLDGAAALNSANAGTLGDIYLSGLDFSIRAGGWVNIWAH